MSDKPTKPDYSSLSAVFINTTLRPSPQDSQTDTLMDVVRSIMAGAGVEVKSYRAVDHDIAPGVYPDMTEHGFETDAWPTIAEEVLLPDILVVRRQDIWHRLSVDRL